MSNKEFESKVLSALGDLNNKFDSLDAKIDGVEAKLGKQTTELKNEMWQQTAYLNQAFVNMLKNS